MNRVSSILTVAIALALAGCAQVSTTKRTDAAYSANEQRAAELRSTMAQVDEGESSARPLVRVVDTPYIDPEPIAPRSTAESSLDCEITFTAGSTTLLAFAQQIGRDCGVPVRVTPDALAHIRGESGAAAGPVLSGAPTGVTAGLPLPPLPSGGAEVMALSLGGSLSPDAGTITLPPPGYVGRVDGLLNAVTSRFGLSWSHSDRGISIHYLQTRRFTLDAFSTSMNFSSSFETGTTASTGQQASGGGSGGGSSGIQGSLGSQQSTSISTQSALYADVESSIKAMLSPAGKVAMNRTSGAVIVTDAPEVLDAIETYLRGENEALNKQITFHVKVYQVAVNDSAQAGVDWSLLYNTLSGNYGITSNAGSVDPQGIGTLGVSVLNTATGSAQRWRGSNVFVQALSTMGKVTTVMSPSVITQNLRPAPVQTARQIGYIPSVQTSQTTNAGSLTGTQVEFITVGFSMTLIPRILDSGQIMVQMSTTISSLNGTETRQVGDSTVDIPDIDLRKFDATANLRSGETLVLHGFEQVSESGSRRGTVSPFAWMLGGGIDNEGQRSQLVIAITPVVGS